MSFGGEGGRCWGRGVGAGPMHGSSVVGRGGGGGQLDECHQGRGGGTN